MSGWRDLYVSAERTTGSTLDGVHLGALAHHLPVHLAVGRNVDDHVAAELRRAAEPAARPERRPLLVIAALDRPELREVLDAGVHPVLGELADALHDLAAAADAPPAAYRVEIHPERPRRIEDRGADRELPRAAPMV